MIKRIIMVNPPELRGAAFISINLLHLVDEKRYGKLINRDICGPKIYENSIIKKKKKRFCFG